MPATMPLLEVTDLDKTFTVDSRSVTAIDHLSLSIDEHEFVSIVGPSGCGTRPGRIKADIRIPNLDRSGDYRKSREYLALRVEVWDLVQDEVVKARALEEA
jgi:hypothetical protein